MVRHQFRSMISLVPILQTQQSLLSSTLDQQSNWVEISANPDCYVFECVYGESRGLIRKNIKSGHSKMVLKYCAVSTLPHHLMTYSWGPWPKAQPCTVLLLAASLLWREPGINRRHPRVQLLLQLICWSNVATLQINTFLVIVQNTH